MSGRMARAWLVALLLLLLLSFSFLASPTSQACHCQCDGSLLCEQQCTCRVGVGPGLKCIDSTCVCYSSCFGDSLNQVATDWKVSFPSWVHGTDPCKTNWKGVECDATGVNIVSLNLSNQNLQGPVPAAIGDLAYLTSLDISNIKNNVVNNNAITGDVSALAPLTKLQTFFGLEFMINIDYGEQLQLCHKSESGLILTANILGIDKFPEVLQSITSLVILKVDNTMIPGPFPVGLSNLKKLQVLWLGNNSFNGPLPKEIGNMINLVELTLWGSSYNCALPPELGKLVNLTYLNCNRCTLWGGLPPELSMLTKLQRLHLYTNNLTGPIPTEWKELRSLREMRIEQNSLFGSFDPWLLGLPNLKLLNLNSNQLYKSLPPIFNSTTTNFTALDLNCNYFSGPYPDVHPNIQSQLDANCYSNPGVNDPVNAQCLQRLSCTQFQQYLKANGGCPPCPPTQYLHNPTLGICYGEKIQSSQKVPISAVVGAVLGALALLAAILSLCIWKYRKRRLAQNRDYFQSLREGDYWEIPKGVHRYSLQDLAQATNEFDREHVIGAGAFGKVFKGYFPDGKTVAIKRAAGQNTSAQCPAQFRNEVLLLSRLDHKNLVRLEGFCDENNLQILVNEHMINGNLHSHLFRKNAARYLDWYKRLEIAVNIAEGLEYLHSYADPPLIHRDVKPSNILLDDNLVAKVADFRISNESPESETHASTRPTGTAGYFDPQNFIRRHYTTASDVYSYGIILLELITGQKAIDLSSRGDEYNLIEWVKLRLREDDIDLIVDPTLKGTYPREILQGMIDLAIRCSAFENNGRPSMKTVVSTLELHLQAAQRLDTANESWNSLGSTFMETPPFSNDHSICTNSSSDSTNASLRRNDAAGVISVLQPG